MPREHNKTLVELAGIVPGSPRQALHHFLHDAPWDARGAQSAAAPAVAGAPVSAPMRAACSLWTRRVIPSGASASSWPPSNTWGNWGMWPTGWWRSPATGRMVAGMCRWGSGRIGRPVACPRAAKIAAFHTKPPLAWELIEEARAAGIPFRLVVADTSTGRTVSWRRSCLPPDPLYHGPASLARDLAICRGSAPARVFPPRRLQRLPRAAWERTVRFDSHGQALLRYIAELELGPTYGPDTGVRLDRRHPGPYQLKPESTWYLATSLPLAEVSAEQVYELYRLRDWIEHFYKPVKHELGWADYQVRPERAIVRHWHLVMLAYTFSLLIGAGPPSPGEAGGGKIGASRRPQVQRAHRVRFSGVGRLGPALRQVRAWLCPWARLQLYWRRWSSTPHRPNWPRSSPTSLAPSL